MSETGSPSTPAEIAAVEADWSARSTLGINFTVERTALVNGFTLARVSFQFDGLTQYGFLRYPRDHGPAGIFPGMVLHHGGAEWVEAEMTGLGASQPAFEFFPYPQAAHGTGGMTELGLRVEPYICDYAGEVSAVDTPPLRPELRAWPNPFQGQVDIRLSGSDAGKTRGLSPILEILDVRGRVVRSLRMEAGGARWDGRNAAGRIVPAGVYLARTRLSGRAVEVSGAPAKLKLLVLH